MLSASFALWAGSNPMGFETGTYFLGGKGECLLDLHGGSSWFPNRGFLEF